MIRNRRKEGNKGEQGVRGDGANKGRLSWGRSRRKRGQKLFPRERVKLEHEGKPTTEFRTPVYKAEKEVSSGGGEGKSEG